MPQTYLGTAGLEALTEKDRRLIESRANCLSSQKKTLIQHGLHFGPRRHARQWGYGRGGNEQSPVLTLLTELTGDTGGNQIGRRVHLPRIALTQRCQRSRHYFLYH